MAELRQLIIDLGTGHVKTTTTTFAYNLAQLGIVSMFTDLNRRIPILNTTCYYLLVLDFIVKQPNNNNCLYLTSHHSTGDTKCYLKS